MSFYKIAAILLLPVFLASACSQTTPTAAPFNPDNMMIRIAALEIDSAYLEEYLAILKEEAAASVRLEPGVICIYPMFQKEDPTQIRLLEIYADEEAYESHLQTPHFLKYKTTTLEMVKSLELIDMSTIDPETMPEIFSKLKD